MLWKENAEYFRGQVLNVFNFKIKEVERLSFITAKKSEIVDFFEYLAIIVWHVFWNKEVNKNL